MTRSLRLLIRSRYIGVGVIHGIFRVNQSHDPGPALATNPTNVNISAMNIQIEAVAAVTVGVIGTVSLPRALHYKKASNPSTQSETDFA